MKLTFTGVVSISSGASTVIAFLSDDIQRFVLPENKSAELAPVLSERGFIVSDNVLQFAGRAVVLAVESRHFSRVEIVPFSEEDAAAFFVALQSDADLVALSTSLLAEYKKRASALFEGLIAIIDELPEDGSAVALVESLEKMNWSDAAKEFLIAFKTTQPQNWDKLLSLIDEKYKNQLESFVA